MEVLITVSALHTGGQWQIINIFLKHHNLDVLAVVVELVGKA